MNKYGVFCVLFYIVGAVLTIVVKDTLYLGALFVVLTGLQIISNVPLKSLAKVIAFTLPFLAFITLLQGIGQSDFYEGKLLSVLSMTFFRMFNLILLSFWLVNTLSPLELSRSLVVLLSPLKKIVPLNDIALIFSLSLHFVPMLIKEYQHIKEARFVLNMQSKGLKVFIHALVPLLASALHHAEELTYALEVKAPEIFEEHK